MKVDMQRIADSVGIPKELFDKWSENASIVDKKDDEDGVYNMDGPIVGTAFHASLGYMDGLCSPQSLQDFLKRNKGKPIEIDINSPGGSVFDANAMFSQLLRHEGDITLNILGTCYSAATFFLGLPDAHRVAYDGADFMVHRAWTVAAGDESDFAKLAEQLRKIDRNIAKRLAKTTDYDADSIHEMMVEETFFGAEDAEKWGFVDEIIDGEDEEPAETEDEKPDEDEEMQDFVKPAAVGRADVTAINEVSDLYIAKS